MSHWDEYPLYGSYDVVVAGGGTAGFAAGASAARCGLKTLIVEEMACLGGTSTAGGVGVFFGFERGEETENLTGIVGDVMRGLIQKKGCDGIHTVYCLGLKAMDVPAAQYNDDLLKIVMDEIVHESGAQVLFHTRFIAVDMEEGKIRHLIIHNSKGIQRVASKVFIDASFHASVAADAGVPCMQGNTEGELQPGTLMYKTGNVDFAQYEAFPVSQRRKLAAEGLASGDMVVNFLLARQLQNTTVFHNQTRIPVNPLDPENWSEGERVAREQVLRVSKWWFTNVPGFQDAYLSSISPVMGLRDSRRIVGKFVLTGEELMKGEHYPDTVASSSYPIDVHHRDGNRENTLIRPAAGVFHVPYRCLITREVDNLLVVGRCISADDIAHAALRVTITCMRTGEAAGRAAKAALDAGIPVNELDGNVL